MEVWHRVAFNGDNKPEFKQAIEKLGVRYKTTPLPSHRIGLVFFDIPESHICWSDVAELISRHGASDVFETVFDNAELLASKWLRLVPVFQQGYPQPEETWVTNPINYTNRCPQCGTFQQGSSFRIKKEPNLGKKDFMNLFWTYALFCTPKVLGELKKHEIRGYEIWDVILHKANTRSEKVSQLFIPTIAANPGLARTDDLKRGVCLVCNVTKYQPHRKDIMYLGQYTIISGVDILQTYEWFGDGHAAYREILISNKLARLILDQNWKGVALKVVELI